MTSQQATQHTAAHEDTAQHDVTRQDTTSEQAKPSEAVQHHTERHAVPSAQAQPCEAAQQQSTLQHTTLNDFSCALASSAPTPGGGGAAALAGALGSNLVEMVGNLTTGKKKYAAFEDELQRIIATAEDLSQKLRLAIDEDAAAFAPLAKAYGIPKDNPTRAKTLEAALRAACKPPMHIIELALRALNLHERMALIGSRLVISDCGAGAVLCNAAVNAAAFSVFANTKLMADEAYALHVQETTQRTVVEAHDKTQRICAMVTRYLIREGR